MNFESNIESITQTTSMGNFEVTKVRIHNDLLQEGLKKKPAKSAASFVTIGEPDICPRLASSTILPTSKPFHLIRCSLSSLLLFDPHFHPTNSNLQSILSSNKKVELGFVSSQCKCL